MIDKEPCHLALELYWNLNRNLKAQLLGNLTIPIALYWLCIWLCKVINVHSLKKLNIFELS